MPASEVDSVEVIRVNLVRSSGVLQQRHSARLGPPRFRSLIVVGKFQRLGLYWRETPCRADDGLLITVLFEDVPSVREFG